MTTELEKELADKIVENLKKDLCYIYDFIIDVSVNDYGRFGNFSVLIYFNNRYSGPLFGRGIANSIKGFVSRVIKRNGGILRDIEFPMGKYTNSYGIKYFEGYDRDYISIDLDFRKYNKISNTFA